MNLIWQSFFLPVLFTGFLDSNNGYPSQDFYTHLHVSALLGAVGHEAWERYPEMSSAERFFLGTTMAIGPGLAKELADGLSSNNTFSGLDLAADTLGALSGSLTSALIGKPAYLVFWSERGTAFTVVVGYSP